MAYFVFVTRDKAGKQSRGNMEAMDQQAAMRKLRDSGMMIVTIREAKKPLSFSKGFAGGIFQRQVKLKDLAVFSYD
jgi:type II secretory pathway component PulF